MSRLLNAGLIAIGSRGLTSLPHRLLGATAERVAELSNIPVLIIKSESHGVVSKKEAKQKKKRQKKDRKQLKSLLGIDQEESVAKDADE